MTHIAKVTIAVELNNGDTFSSSQELPSPVGDNPRLLGEQLKRATDALGEKYKALIESQYPGQIYR